ncbi:Putative Phosphoglycerate mutase [[Torrubiella] hemipterigena]|uniref:Putative Phosphoglycerate mutase n=1 Tax=[Torrubiella] hemipterigena TaxID=1531966 RepID=A0A0A1T2T7_9HYPO|nr:Putative Phosphoglycerate mutase [[Torrubiella] hemipterigena]
MKISAVSAIAVLASSASACWPEAEGKSIKYTAVPGYFLQDDANTNVTGFDYADHNFGLIDRKYPTDRKFDPKGTKKPWERFANWVKYLNNNCQKDSNVRYKVLVMGRHGQGFHNAAESYYGTPAWNCYWAELNGNGTSVWADAKLTSAGIAEATKANKYFKSRFEQEGMPYFESYYSSPLTRCLQTANITFGDINFPSTHPFAPVIKENFRESISIHTCDHRSTKSEIHQLVPNFSFEDGFTEKDELWRRVEGETSDGQFARNQVVLQDVFTEDESTWISITAHSGEIASLLSVLNHRKFSLSTGQIIPVLVKAEVVSPTVTKPVVSFTPEATCNAPPVTSISGQGCVCSQTGVASSPSATSTA